jgi:hypothetical protein
MGGKFVAMYNGKETVVEADDLYKAKQKAIQYFKVRKSQEHRVYVMLAEREDGSEVVHVPDF